MSRPVHPICRIGVWLAALLGLGGATLAGCGKPAPAASQAGTCLSSLTTPAPSSATSATPSTPMVGGGSASTVLPDAPIECLDGSGSVRLSSVTIPMVVNLWATSCAACKQEMPAVEAFHRAAAGRVAVVGVDNLDPRSFGTSYVSDNGLTYPMLYDPDSKLASALGRHVLPLTLFVRPGGRLMYVYFGTDPLDTTRIADLTARYLGVRVDS